MSTGTGGTDESTEGAAWYVFLVWWGLVRTVAEEAGALSCLHSNSEGKGAETTEGRWRSRA